MHAIDKAYSGVNDLPTTWASMLRGLRGTGWALCWLAAIPGSATLRAADGSAADPVLPEELPTITILGRDLGAPPQPESSAVSFIVGSLVNSGGGIGSVRELQSILPSLTIFDSDNDRIPRFSTRGLRENNFARGESAVTMYLDDVPYADLASRGLLLYDLDRGAFLRGPQGTLYGASGPGGVLDLHSRQPGNDYRAYGQFGYGNYDALEGQGSVSGPVVKDKLFLGVTGLYDRRDGFVHNRTLDTDADTKENLSGRVQLRWTPTEDLAAAFTLSADRFNDGFVPTFYPGVDANLFDVSRDLDGHVDTEAFTQALRVTYNGPGFKATSISAHRTWEQDLLQDFDFGPVSGVLGFSRPEFEQWSQELRFQSPDGAERCRWLGGLFFSDKTFDVESGSIQPLGQPLPFPPGFLPGPLTRLTTAQFEDRNYAAFGQSTVEALPGLDLVAGARLEWNDRSLSRRRTDDALALLGAPPIPDVALDDGFGAVSPRAGVVYHCWPNHDLYFTATRGYQSGGFNAANDTPEQARYASSRSWHFEVGHKADWIRDRLSSRVAFYYAEYDRYQVFRFNPADPTQAIVANADKVYSYGAEGEVLAQPWKGLELTAQLSAGDSRFDRFDYTLAGQPFDFGQKRVNFVPQFNVNLAAQYRCSQHIVARIEWQGVGEYYLDEANTARQGAFGLVNARIGYEHRHFEVFAFVRNLLDREYASNALDFRNAFQPDLLVRQPGDPLTFGFMVRGKL
jgi:iron complex outermembrane receptor protein